MIAGAALALVSLGVWRVVVAAATGRIRKNDHLGLRTSETLASEEAWQEGHRATLPVLQPLCLVAGVSSLAGAVLAYWRPAGGLLVWVAAALLIAGAIVGGSVANRAARAMSRDATCPEPDCFQRG